MTVRNGKHQLIGLVSLGRLYDDMKVIETGEYELNVIIMISVRQNI